MSVFFLWLAINSSRTFKKTSVEIYNINHNSSYYTGASGSLSEFWANVLPDAFNLTGAKYNDPNNIWIFYTDAEGNGGGTSGVALLPSHDLRGISGTEPSNKNVDRWIGGLGHELGHALGLVHPSACEDSSQDTICPDTIMYLGYLNYPNTNFLQEEKDLLKSRSFIVAC